MTSRAAGLSRAIGARPADENLFTRQFNVAVRTGGSSQGLAISFR